MKVRRIAIAFALLSAIYWITASVFQQIIFMEFGAAFIPYWKTAALVTLPGLIYAVVCIYFFHWFARRIARMLKTTPKQES